VTLLYPGPNAVEVLGIVNRFPGIRCLHIIESCEANIDAIHSALEKEVSNRQLPQMAGYVTDLVHLPEELAGCCDLVVEIKVVDPKANKLFRQDVARQISRLLELGGLFYSAGEPVRWTDGIIPLTLARVPVHAEFLARVGYSDALPKPVLHLKHSPDVPALMAEEGPLREWWRKGLELIGQGTREADGVTVQTPFVPRAEDSRGEPDAAPSDFLITTPAVRRPAMHWTPKEGTTSGAWRLDRFSNITARRACLYSASTSVRTSCLRL